MTRLPLAVLTLAPAAASSAPAWRATRSAAARRSRPARPVRRSGPPARVSGLTAAFAPLRDGGALLVTTPLDRRGLTATDITSAARVVRGLAERRLP